MAFKNRKSIPMKKSKKMFRKSASRTHKKNIPTSKPKRGGIRL